MKVIHSHNNQSVVLASGKGTNWHTTKQLHLVQTQQDGSRRILKTAEISTRQDKWSKAFAQSTTTKFINLCNGETL